ncbi:MAG: tRNA (N(6)-L-threonylcarbamoyladenosine(37)-C(2))-methylthiotransferase [Thermoplasmata archaeon]
MRVYVESYGCAQNQGEGRGLTRDLAAAGHSIAEDPSHADVGVLVTCGVIGPTEMRMVRRWEELSRRVPRMVVTGCLVPLRTDLLQGPGLDRTTFLPIREQSRLSSMLAEWASDDAEPVRPTLDPTLPIPPALSVAEEVVIAQGCTSHCSYCYSRLARGRLTSVPMGELLERVRDALARGAKEIRLTSLDTSCWGEDLAGEARLPDLVTAVAQLSGDFQFRIGMMSPQSLRRIGDRLLDALVGEKAFHFLHIPIQSGSDRILQEMRRGYTIREFRQWVDRARSRFPDLMLATDVIVGFPGETEDDFRATTELIEEVEPEIVNVTRFSARPLTPAARLPRLPPRVAKRRSRELTALRMRVARRRFERWIGWHGSARVVEWGAEGSSVGRLPNYIPVVLEGRYALGTVVPIRIEGARSTYLLGAAVGS